MQSLVPSLFCCRRVLIASIMEEYNKEAWETLIERCEEVGVDAFEINFSCPHGMPERKMGMAMGQDCDILKVCPLFRVMWSRRFLGFRF